MEKPLKHQRRLGLAKIVMISKLTLYLIEMPFYAFANRAGLNQAALVYYVCYWKYDVYDPTLVDLTSMCQHESLFI